VKDSTSLLRSATRRAKSDVANKLVSMFLHELSRAVSEGWPIKVSDEEYGRQVREWFKNGCPYCSCELVLTTPVVEHLDGMNRYRAGLHAPGNVLVACRKCNNEKRRDDSAKDLFLATTGWESFLSHDATRCAATCLTCEYWKGVWPDEKERTLRLSENLQRLRSFRGAFPEFEKVLPSLKQTLPGMLTKLYTDCQGFAEKEIKFLLKSLKRIPRSQT
jgi:hypothetical protein